MIPEFTLPLSQDTSAKYLLGPPGDNRSIVLYRWSPLRGINPYLEIALLQLHSNFLSCTFASAFRTTKGIAAAIELQHSTIEFSPLGAHGLQFPKLSCMSSTLSVASLQLAFLSLSKQTPLELLDGVIRPFITPFGVALEVEV